jgi:acetyl-CoA C-acetyltransferase
MNRVFIIEGARTPFLKSDNKRGPFTGVDLAVHASKEALVRSGIMAEDVSEVVLGSVMIEPEEVNPARSVAIRTGCLKYTPAYTVQRNCTSGLEAIDAGYKDIMLGRHDVVLCGGTEAMSHAAFQYRPAMSNWFSQIPKKRTVGQKLRHLADLPAKQLLNPVISLMEGLKDPFNKVLMGVTAENIANMANIGRREMDEYAVRSHLRALSYDYSKEIAPMFDSNGVYYDTDGGVRKGLTVEKLGKMRPAFTHGGTVTAGNSSQITDGAAMLVIASEQYVRYNGLTPIAEILDIQHAALEPMEMGLGPVPVIKSLLKDNNIPLGSVTHVEINEAFAGQVLACNAQLNLDEEILNPHGGAVAMGHPIGASLARLALHALYNVEAYSIVSGCVGGGQGSGMLIQKVT